MSALQAVFKWARTNPKTTFGYAASGIVILNPSVVTIPILYTMGFEAAGPRANSTAAEAMRHQKRVTSKSSYAAMQSAAMGGYGTDTAANTVRAGAVMLVGVLYFWRRRTTRIATIKKLPGSR